ncbi:MAG: TIGR00730 family Rossman fold protein [Candidatus Woesearchaeota archaeon]
MNELLKNKKYFDHANKTADNVDEEIASGLKILHKIDRKIIGVFGTHALSENSKEYRHCMETSYRLGLKKYAILTGGGPGVMKAANTGAMKAKTYSIGFKAGLLKKEQSVNNSIFTHTYSFKFLFTRRFCLAIKSNALIFYPGGYGTLNEFFEYVTLIQTEMTDPVPVILVDKKYWKGLFAWLKKETLARNFITEKHLKDLYFADTTKEIIDIIEKRT